MLLSMCFRVRHIDSTGVRGTPRGGLAHVQSMCVQTSIPTVCLPWVGGTWSRVIGRKVMSSAKIHSWLVLFGQVTVVITAVHSDPIPRSSSFHHHHHHHHQLALDRHYAMAVSCVTMRRVSLTRVKWGVEPGTVERARNELLAPTD